MTRRANLEGVYGAGPAGSPYLYRKDDPARLLLSPSGCDVPRNHEGIALVGDPRNDVHLFVSQMQVAFINLHNRLVERLRDDAVGDVFEQARREATWHYQHVILREFLPGLIGAELSAELLDHGPRLYRVDGEPYIPIEFADAAYRYGHAQIRDRYQVNEHFGPCPVFPDLMGFGPVAPEHTVDWALQIDLDGHPPAQRAKRIDARLPASLIALPTQVSGCAPGTDYASLANRDLQRGQAVGLASGEAVARRLGVPQLSAAQIGLGWAGETPLWFYILKEAEIMHGGERLGPVGGRIVGEVLVGIIDGDPESFRAVDPDWWPTLPGGATAPSASPTSWRHADAARGVPGVGSGPTRVRSSRARGVPLAPPAEDDRVPRAGPRRARVRLVHDADPAHRRGAAVLPGARARDRARVRRAPARLGVRVRYVRTESEPYDSAEELCAELRERGSMALRASACDPPHPLLANGVFDQLRVVHDVFGHGALGLGFDLQSEFGTWLQCRTLFSRVARPAAFCELVGAVTAYVTTGVKPALQAKVPPVDLLRALSAAPSGS